MIPILYESTETAFVSNGLGRLLECTNCKVVEQRNGIYECDFDYPVTGTHYDEIYPGRIVGVTHDDTGDIQPFDIVSYSRPIDGIVSFHAVHISYRLSGQVVWSTSIMNSDVALSLFGNVSGTPFTYNADFSVNNTYMAAADGVPRTVRQMLGGMEGSFLDSYGGEIEWNKWNVFVHKARGIARNMSIRYGINMSQYAEDTDYQGTYTSCVPYWTGNVDGKDVIVRGARIDADMVSYNGRRTVVPLDLSDKFENKPTSAQLGSMALAIMSANKTNLPAQSISVDFIRLQDDPYYEQFSGLMTCRLCDTINVVFPMYGITGRYKIVQVTWDVLAERYDGMELGSPAISLSEALGITGDSPRQTVGDDLAVAGDLTVSGTITSGGKITSGGRIVLPYNTYFAAKDASNNEQGMAFFYNGTEYFGNNSFPTTIRGSSISLSNPLSSFYKVTTVTVSVAALSAHANVAASSHTMTAQSGFNAVGIVGWSSGSYRIRPTTHYIASNTSLYAGFANTSAGATSQAFNVVFYVLWLKATSA